VLACLPFKRGTSELASVRRIVPRLSGTLRLHKSARGRIAEASTGFLEFILFPVWF
jgi:hypothetical protein